MEDDKRAPPPQTFGLQPAHSVLSWIAGEVPPPFEADNAQGVALALGRAYLGRGLPRVAEADYEGGRGADLHLFCEKRRPLSCRHCTSADAILALSVLHYGASAAGEAQMLLPRVGLLNMVTRKKTGLLAMFRLSLKKRSDRSMSYEEARAQLLMLRDKEVLRARLRG